MRTAVAVGCAKGIKNVSKLADTLEAGEYAIDTYVHVTGKVTKGEDYEQVIHMAVPHWAVIAVLLSKVNGVTAEYVKRIVVEAMGLEKAQIDAVKAQAEAACDVIKAAAKETCSGKVTTKLEFEEVAIPVGQVVAVVAENETATV